MTEGAVVLPSVVTQPALSYPGQLGGTFSALEVLLRQTELRADVDLQLAGVVPGAGDVLLVQAGEEETNTTSSHLLETMIVDQVTT